MKYYYINALDIVKTDEQIANNGGNVADMLKSGMIKNVKYPLSKANAEKIVNRLVNDVFNEFQTIGTIEYAKHFETIAFLIQNARDVVAKQERPFTMEETKTFYGLHLTLKHSGKMSGMYSLSTTCKNNPFCRARIEHAEQIAKKYGMQAKDLICFNCFSESQTDNYGESFLKPFLFNTFLLSNVILPADVLPIINAHSFRFESFGDIQNITQQFNYFNICRKNPRVFFTQWTKNPAILARTLELTERPKNIKFVFSELKINSMRTLADIRKKYAFFDSIFRVYTKDYIKEHGIKINCGARHCLSCMLCYSWNDVTEINEELK